MKSLKDKIGKNKKKEFERFQKDCISFSLKLKEALSTEHILCKYPIGVHMAVLSNHLEFLKESAEKIDRIKEEI